MRPSCNFTVNFSACARGVQRRQQNNLRGQIGRCERVFNISAWAYALTVNLNYLLMTSRSLFRSLTCTNSHQIVHRALRSLSDNIIILWAYAGGKVIFKLLNNCRIVVYFLRSLKNTQFIL